MHLLLISEFIARTSYELAYRFEQKTKQRKKKPVQQLSCVMES